MRLFVAVDLAPGAELPRVVGRLPAHFHATLRFFEDLPEGSVALLREALQEAVAPVSPFDLELRGIGGFPSTRQPRVVWVGFGRGRAAVDRLAERLDASLHSRGFPADPRPFLPHATVARVRNPRERQAAEQILERGAGLSFGTQRVEEILLYESRLDPSGAVHRPLATVRLAGTG
ncbi:MAG: RNA 2',3'-cyclic phosphodiesterase [Thermoplasmata archaeon]|nr:RNA 2',3'-cyclic phosphodiesterase [Thermoplasmata archaeon]